jgi:hypothetical protein
METRKERRRWRCKIRSWWACFENCNSGGALLSNSISSLSHSLCIAIVVVSYAELMRANGMSEFRNKEFG